MSNINKLKSFLNSKEYLIGIYENKVYILNYKLVLNVSESIIKIKIKSNNLIIKGENLYIDTYDKNEILIMGLIKSVDLS